THRNSAFQYQQPTLRIGPPCARGPQRQVSRILPPDPAVFGCRRLSTTLSTQLPRWGRQLESCSHEPLTPAIDLPLAIKAQIASTDTDSLVPFGETEQ